MKMNDSPFFPFLKEAFQENGFSHDSDIDQKLIQYLHLLERWNRTFNLTTITDPRDMVYLHIVDSLVISPYLQENRLLDVGSGAGLPGIPLAITHPHQEWTLLDKNSKKTRFLTQAVAELGLKNVTVIHQRVEDFHPQVCFNSILSRAYGTLRLFVESTEHLLCENGVFLAMKGKYPQEEQHDLPQHILVQDVERLYIKGIDIERHIVSLNIKKGTSGG